MYLRWLFAVLHLLALAIGLPAIWNRSRALGGTPDADSLRRAFRADTLWGLAAGLWILTGLVRAFGGLEKGTAYYLGNGMFIAKMALLVVIFALEIWPMFTLMRWRMILAREGTPDTRSAPLIARISQLQLVLAILMVFAATAMARNIGF